MEPALWAAKTGLDAQQTQMTVTANNLANVNTNGFKKSRAVFDDLLYQNVSQVGAATSQNTVSPVRPAAGHRRARGRHREELHPGQPRQHRQRAGPGDPGPRFLPGAAARTARSAYTRDGSFQVNAQGQLVNASGYQVQPAITIPQRCAERDHRPDGVGQRAAGRAVSAHAGRHPAAGRFHQSGGPAGRRRQPRGRVRPPAARPRRATRASTASARWCRARSRAPTSTSSRRW